MLGWGGVHPLSLWRILSSLLSDSLAFRLLVGISTVSRGTSCSAILT